MSAMAETRSRRPRRRFTDEFKQQAVRLVLDEGKSVTAVARELDLVASALGQWVKHAQADRSKGRTGLTTAEREELVRLRKALRIAEEERDILKKATAFGFNSQTCATSVDATGGRLTSVRPMSDHLIMPSTIQA